MYLSVGANLNPANPFAAAGYLSATGQTKHDKATNRFDIQEDVTYTYDPSNLSDEQIKQLEKYARQYVTAEGKIDKQRAQAKIEAEKRLNTPMTIEQKIAFQLGSGPVSEGKAAQIVAQAREDLQSGKSTPSVNLWTGGPFSPPSPVPRDLTLSDILQTRTNSNSIEVDTYDVNDHVTGIKQSFSKQSFSNKPDNVGFVRGLDILSNALFVSEKGFTRSYKIANAGFLDSRNSWDERAVNLVGGSILLPFMMAEELTRGLLNVPSGAVAVVPNVDRTIDGIKIAADSDLPIEDRVMGGLKATQAFTAAVGGVEFWETANKPWLSDAIKRGDNFRLVSDPFNEMNIYQTSGKKFVLDSSENRIKSIFGREIDYLKVHGYEFLPNGTAVKKIN